MSLLSIREGESGNHHHHHHKAKKEPSSSKALLFEKVKEAEERLVRSGSDAVEESLVIISPHGLNPKVKRLVLKPYCLTILGYKTGKFNRQWPLEDIVKVKRHAINHNCFTVTCLERKKKKIKNQRYSFEVKSEIECWRWIEVLTAATSALLNEQNKSSAGSQLSPSDSGTLKRTRSTSAPPAMAPPLMRGQPLNSKTAETDEDEDEENDPYADELSDDDEDDSRHHHGAAQHKEKEVEPAQRKGLVAFAADAQQKDNWAHFQPSGASNTPPGTAMRNGNYASPAATVTFNPFAPASGQQPAQPISPYSAQQGQAQQHSQPQLQQQHSQPQFQQQHSQPQLQQLPPMQPMNHQQAFHMQQQQQQASHSFSHSPVAQSLASPPSSLNHMSPPSSSAAAQHKAADAPKSASAIYITTMSPPAHMRIVQDLGLLSATGSAAAPTNPTQCGAQVEAALQAARQELSLRAASRGANAVFQTSFSTAFHQWGVTVLACGTACVATMVTN